MGERYNQFTRFTNDSTKFSNQNETAKEHPRKLCVSLRNRTMQLLLVKMRCSLR
uniref:Uncharacterized protein n=1 Tax=Solanum tuberosum TaxID=4113 RepID=M1BIR5_SOLTU